MAEKSTAMLLGCGIGFCDDTVKLVHDIISRVKCPIILDADGINAVATNINILKETEAPLILTPHPGEMARLCKTDIASIQENREKLAMDFAREHKCILVLKGKNTVIADGSGDVFINQSGSSALAKGGSGDVLAGVIASLLAQGYRAEDAAKLGVYVHGLAADNLEKSLGKSGVLPSDLPKEIGRILG
jgi:NAD(P)H-hydrate epimerase